MQKNQRLLIRFIKGEIGYGVPFYGIIIIVFLLMCGAFSSSLLDQDEMIYALVAADMLDGKLPYQGVFDHKPIGVYYVYAFFFGIFGENFIAIRIMTVSLLGGTALCIFYGLRRLNFGRSALVVSFTTCLAFPIGIDGLSGNTESIQTFILALVFFLIVRIQDENSTHKKTIALFYGALVALGFSVNYLFSFLGMFSFLSLILFLFSIGKSIRYLTIISFYTAGGFFLGSSIIYSPYFFDYLTGGELLLEYLSDQIVFLTSYGANFDKSLVVNKLFKWIVPFTPIIVSGALMFYTLEKEKKIVGFFSIGTFLAACIAASASMMFFNHYWILSTVSIALFSAIAVESSKELQSSLIIRYGHSITLLIFIVSGSGRIVNHTLNIGAERELKQANAFIKHTIGTQEPVVTISTSPVYVFLNKLNTDQKYHFEGHVEQLHNAGVLDGDAYFMGLLEKNPTYTLVEPKICDRESFLIFVDTCECLKNNYSLISSFQGVRPVSIYKRINDFEVARHVDI